MHGHVCQKSMTYRSANLPEEKRRLLNGGVNGMREKVMRDGARQKVPCRFRVMSSGQRDEEWCQVMLADVSNSPLDVSDLESRRQDPGIWNIWRQIWSISYTLL